jgi:hypothetical protein
LATAAGLAAVIVLSAAACDGGDGEYNSTSNADATRTLSPDRLGGCEGLLDQLATDGETDRAIEDLLQDPSDPLAGAEFVCQHLAVLAPNGELQALTDCLEDPGFGWGYEMPEETELILTIESARFGNLVWRFEKQEDGWVAIELPRCPDQAG